MSSTVSLTPQGPWRLRVSHLLRTVIQVALLALVWLVADQLVHRLHLPIPANLTGMLLLLGLICLRLVKVEWFRDGARWLLAEMLLFFIPAVVAVINYRDLMLSQGVRILAVILISTAITLGFTALVVDRLYRLELYLARRKRSVRG